VKGYGYCFIPKRPNRFRLVGAFSFLYPPQYFQAKVAFVHYLKPIKMSRLIVLLIICLWSNACHFQGYTQNFETTIQVVEVDGKPLKGRVVKFYKLLGISYFVGSTSHSPEGTVTTDVNGNAVFNYGLDISDSNSDYATFTTEEDTVWKLVSYPYHLVSAKKKKKQTLKIVMDSLTTIRIRLQKTSATPLELSLLSADGNNVSNINYGDYYSHNTDVHRAFFGWNRKSVGVFDSVFTFKIFSKANCWTFASTNMVTADNISTRISSQNFDFKPSQKRDTIIHFIVQ
jgi:hypothetical protein